MSKARESYEIAQDRGMGAIPFHDPRDMLYRMRDFVRPSIVGETRPARVLHEPGNTLDQGHEGSCVGHGWTGWENTKPVGHQRQQGHEFAVKWYHTAQENDAWPGTDYEGTSVVAGAKVGRMWGLLETWLNAATVEDIYNFLWRGGDLGKGGPVVMGTVWKESMDRMTPDYFLDVDLSTRTRGGHCWLITGYLEDDVVVCQNSWGIGYGDEGFFYLTRVNLDKLLNTNGTAMGAVQTGVPPR